MLTVTPLTTKGTKCYLYFDEELMAADVILAGKAYLRTVLNKPSIYAGL